MMKRQKKPVMPEKKAGKTKKAGLSRRVISNLLIVTGILLIVVPYIITRMNASRNEDIIDQFLKEAEQAASQTEDLAGEDVESFYENDVDLSDELSPSSTPSPSEAPAPPPQDSAVAPGPDASPSVDPQPQSSDKTPIMSKAEIQKRMTGVLVIDKIDLKMVVMDGVDEETLRVAAGRMPETGQFDEIGNVVLAGHRSYTFDKYFNRLDELVAGDVIVVKTKTKTLKYEVYKKHIVEPNDFSITYGNDTDKILTLFTCHPVMIASHRLVVHAKQIE